MKRLCIILMGLFLSFECLAADQQVIKEETTPPPAADALTPDQIPPILSATKLNVAPAPEQKASEAAPTAK